MSKRMSWVLVWAWGAPSFHTADVAEGNWHFKPLTCVSGFGGSAGVCAWAPAAAPRMSRKANVSLIISIPMKRLVIVLSLMAGSVAVTMAGAQAPDSRMRQLFPSATTFSPKGGDPPHIKAYNGQTLLGYVFWTTELLPLERGYGGPIAILVGLDMKGTLTGLYVGEHHEPYGDFSIDPPAFAAQFKGKDVRDPFKLGEDVDAVSRATITMSSAVRAIRNSSRRVARTFLTPPAPPSR
jgi:transcriptional regulator of nitric oxide reductase